MIRRRLFAAALAALLCACSQQPERQEVVNVYSARHYDSDTAVFAAFTQKTGIQVRVLQSNADQLLERLQQEGEATQADVVITVDGGALWRLAEGGVLAPVDTPALREAVPARLHDAQNRWWAISKRARVILYRRDAFNAGSPPPQSFDDLTAPQFRGQVCVRSSTNTYNLSLLAARIERDGPAGALAWARGIVANFARPPQGADTDQIKAVADGVCKVAIVNHYYYVRMLASPDPADRAIAEKVAIVFPDQNGAGTHVNISGAGISAHAPHRDNAVALMEFLVSPQAQEMFPVGNEEFPVRAGVALTPQLQALGPFKEEDIPIDALGRNQPRAAQIFEQAGWR